MTATSLLDGHWELRETNIYSDERRLIRISFTRNIASAPFAVEAGCTVAGCCQSSCLGASRMETLEFIIYPDGRVEEKVSGIKGHSCAQVTEALEEQLGTVLHQRQTADYFSATTQQDSTVSQSATSW